MSNLAAVTVSDAQKKQFEAEGYFVLERVIPDEHLEMLREDCAHFIDLIHAEMDRKGVDTLGISHRGSRYFIGKRHKQSERLPAFLFSDLMADICRATIGDTAYLFHEAFVVKAAERGMKFGWHQDSGYVGHDHRPYVSCWCPLDDVGEENGTVYILPFERAGTRTRVEHVKEEGTNDKLGYFGADPGIPVIVPAGSIAVFSSVTFHRSGPNLTDRMRRVYLVQYAADAARETEEGTKSFGLGEPFLKNGVKISG